MGTAPRTAVTIVVAVAVYYFVFWIPGSIFLSEHNWAANMLALLCAIAAGAFIWVQSGAASRGLASMALRGALTVGGIAFAVGFFGPMLLGGGNQGPLLGLLITGPLGFVLGGVGGFAYGLARRRP